MSGIGKGVVCSSTGKILQSHGIKVTFVKIDPYINLDAGTLTPLDHGEVFVLSDGTEVDLDLGNYERFLNINLSKDNSITTGKVYNEIINNERSGFYGGKTVQCVPHVTDIIQKRIVAASRMQVKCGVNMDDNESTYEPEVCIVELGGTVGDIESVIFIEALRQLKLKAGVGNFTVVGVEYVPVLSNSEQKTKPIQGSIKTAQCYGLKPDIIVGRCAEKLHKATKEKIALFCEVHERDIFNMPELDTIYRAPHFLRSQNYDVSIMRMLNLKSKLNGPFLVPFSSLFSKNIKNVVNISIVGKYVSNLDSYLSLQNALEFSAAALNLKLSLTWIEAEDVYQSRNGSIEKLMSASGVIVPGGFGTRGFEGKIKAIQFARENNIPFLGICLGYQLAIIEFFRNVMCIKDATSQEFDDTKTDAAIIRMKEVDKNGNSTMILGEKAVHIQQSTKLAEIYRSETVVYERFRHRYKVNPDYIEIIERNGMKFVADNEGNAEIKNAFEVADHPFFLGVQYHPEFLARPDLPHNLFTEFLRNCCG